MIINYKYDKPVTVSSHLFDCSSSRRDILLWISVEFGITRCPPLLRQDS